MKVPGADPSNKLAATMLEVALAEVAEPERLRRGRRYARQGAVNDLVVAPLVVTGAVQGSRARPYEVEVRVAPVRSATHNPRRTTDLVPKSSHLAFVCTCPDWEAPCKHAVAVLTELAERIAYDSTLLDTWRGIDAGEPDGVGADEDEDGDAHPAAVRDEPSPSRSVVDDELARFLGVMPVFEPPSLSPLPHVSMSWDEPWAVMLHDALRVISGAPHPR